MLLRLGRHTSVRLAWFLILATLCVWPLLEHASELNEFRDVHILTLYERAAIDTIKRFGQLPLWNPYFCGGIDSVASPQTRHVSPTLLFGLLFGAQRAEILTVFAFLVLGMEGTYRWLRTRVEDGWACALVAPVFVFTGQLGVAYFRGWIQFFGFLLIPWVLFGITLAARRRVAGVFIAAAAFAWMLGFAGFFAVPLLALVAALEGGSALVAASPRDRPRVVIMLGITVSFMLTLACVRLWPVAETLASAPRIMAGAPGHRASALLSALVGRIDVKDGNTDVPGSFYVGSIFLGLVTLGFHGRRGLAFGGFAWLMVTLAAGHAPRFSTFAWLREIPAFTSLRYPERFLWLAVLFMCGSAAFAVSRVPFAAVGRRQRFAARVLLNGLVLWTLVAQIGAFHRVALARDLGVVSELHDGEFRQARGNRWLAVHVQASGLGSLGCYETHRIAESKLLRGDLPAEEYLAPESASLGNVERRAWSPNLIRLHVDVSGPARVLVNQNWAPGWHASRGRVVSHQGVLAIDLPAGDYEVELSFLPWSTVGGFTTTLVALMALVVLMWRFRHRFVTWSRADVTVTLLMTCLPWLVATAAYAASPDDKWPAAPLTNPDNSPAVVERLPPGASRLDTSLVLPIEVAGSNMSPLDEVQNATIEVYLRRMGKIPRATSMFVHVLRASGEPDAPEGRDAFFNLDHQVVGGSFFLSDAPLNVTVRDAFGVNLTKAASGTWDVWIGFGDVSGKRGRVPVVHPGAAVVRDGLIKIRTFVVP